MKSLGIDFGQAGDYAAAAMIADGVCRATHRWPLHTPYVEIARDVDKMQAKHGFDYVFADATGVGRPVVELVSIPLVRVTITAGAGDPHWGPYGYYCPKRFLVSKLVIAIQSGELAVDSRMPGAKDLLKELSTFQQKIRKSGAVTYEAMRARDHDDLVIALALANLSKSYTQMVDAPKAPDPEQEWRDLYGSPGKRDAFNVVDFAERD